MTNWADELIPEYKKGRAGLREMHRGLTDEGIDPLDKSQINSMVSSMSYSIEWMETGRQPGVFRGMDKQDAYRHKMYDDMDIIPDITEELRKEREPLYLTGEQRETLIELFGKFSERERECYIMHVAERLSMQKIADRLGISKWTVRTYIDRAKEKVAEIAA